MSLMRERERERESEKNLFEFAYHSSLLPSPKYLHALAKTPRKRKMENEKFFLPSTYLHSRSLISLLKSRIKEI
jgi:hypothetical protein